VTTSQPSIVQGSLSSQFGPPLPRHTPLWQLSPVLHELPSSHAVPSVASVWTQPELEEQVSVVQTLLSSQFSAAPAAQAPFWQVSLPLHGSLSAQVVPLGLNPSAGHAVAVPEHDSGRSQAPTAGRHTVPANPAGCLHAPVPSHWSLVHTLPSSVQLVPFAANPFVGHVVDVPVHVSSMSHSLTALRHTTPALPAGCEHAPFPSQTSEVQGRASGEHGAPPAFAPSAGHAVEAPVQDSATSHSPVAARQTVPAFPAGCEHSAEEPSHWSSVQGLLSLEHAVPLFFATSAGHAGFVPSQVSARSHSPAAAWHTVPALPAGCWQRPDAPPQRSSVQALPSSVQAVPVVLNASAGQAAVPVLQVSAMSHSPEAGRQTVAGGDRASAGQVVAVPEHTSAASQAPAAARQTAPALPAAC
jgi:hypothetical protein